MGVKEYVELKQQELEAALVSGQDEVDEFHDRLLTIADLIPVSEGLSTPTPEQWCAVQCGEYHHKNCPVGAALRDCWNTPKWLTALLPRVTLDPCSNPFSSVLALRHVMLEPVTTENDPDPSGWAKSQHWEQGDGLAVSWKNRSVFVNPPYSKILPWAVKAWEARAFIFLVNNVTTTKWYRELLAAGGSYKFEFDKRLKFEPPPRIQPSSNSRDQVLICNREGWQMIGDRLNGYGRWWVEHVGHV